MQKYIFIVVLLLICLSGCGYGVRYATSSIFYQGGQEFDVTPEERGLDFVAVNFENTDGNTLHGWFIPGKDGYPLLIYFHGNVSNISHGLEKIVLLNNLGFSVFSFEYRGYGKSEGRPLNEDDFYRDAESALLWLHRNGWVNRKIIYYGHSLGASVALNLALEEPPLGVILESAFTSFADMFKSRAPFLYSFGGKNVREFNNISKISKIKCPIVLFHGTADEIVPPQMSQELYDKAMPPKKLYFVKGATHVNSLELAQKKLADDLSWFIPDKHLSTSTQ